MFFFTNNRLYLRLIEEMLRFVDLSLKHL